MKRRRLALLTRLAVLGMLLLRPGIGSAQSNASPDEEISPERKTAAPPDAVVSDEQKLAIEQGKLADQYRRFEQVVLRLVELSAGSDPQKARLLRKLIAQSKQDDIPGQFESVIDLLESGQLAVAIGQQESLQQELHELLALLLEENRAERIETEKQRIRRYLKELNRIINQQRDVKGRTEGDGDPGRLATDQQQIAEKTGELSKDMSHEQAPDGKPPAASNSQKPSEGPQEPRETPSEGHPANQPPDAAPRQGKHPDGPAEPPGSPGRPGDESQQNQSPGQQSPDQPSPERQGQDPQSPGEQDRGASKPESAPPLQGVPSAAQRMESARRRMQQAQEELQRALREKAAGPQQEALDELQQAKAELERILRQLREEEIEQTLATLESRFRVMLELQIEVHQGTVRLDQVPLAERSQDEEIEAGRLSRTEAKIVSEADKAMALLREEGSSVAFPEAVQQLRDDMQQVVERLRQTKVDAITQQIEQDIIHALEEIIDAVRQKLREMERQKSEPGKAPPPGEPADPPLVDGLAELLMIRSLQMRVNRRTETYRRLIDADSIAHEELVPALERLSQEQTRIQQAARDLHLGRNQPTNGAE
jgi:hypothetical protein